jgi:hypothetical protein
MKIILPFTSLFFLCIAAPDLLGADWKYIGDNYINSSPTMSFYNAESVECTSNGNLRAWIKGVRITEINRMMRKKDKDLVRTSAEKVMRSYIPPYAFIEDNISFNKSIDIITWEETANHPDTKPSLMILSEIDCKQKMIRTLSAIYYQKGDKIEIDPEVGKWHYVSPGSNGEKLSFILCK